MGDPNSLLVALDLTDGLVLDATGCAHLWGSEPDYLKDIASRLKHQDTTFARQLQTQSARLGLSVDTPGIIVEASLIWLLRS